jgi:hypothetical protein
LLNLIRRWKVVTLVRHGERGGGVYWYVGGEYVLLERALNSSTRIAMNTMTPIIPPAPLSPQLPPPDEPGLPELGGVAPGLAMSLIRWLN